MIIFKVFADLNIYKKLFWDNNFGGTNKYFGTNILGGQQMLDKHVVVWRPSLKEFRQFKLIFWSNEQDKKMDRQTFVTLSTCLSLQFL